MTADPEWFAIVEGAHDVPRDTQTTKGMVHATKELKTWSI